VSFVPLCSRHMCSFLQTNMFTQQQTNKSMVNGRRISPATHKPLRINPPGYSRGVHSILLFCAHSLNVIFVLRLPLENLCSSSWFFQLELCLLLYSSWFLSKYVLGAACRRPADVFKSKSNSPSNRASSQSPQPQQQHSDRDVEAKPLELTEKQRDYMISTFRAMSYVAVFVGAILLLGICIIIGIEFSNTLEESMMLEKRQETNLNSLCSCDLPQPRIPILRYPTLVALGGITIFLFVNSCWICWNVERILSLELAAMNARDAAEQANKAKSNFLSFLAHELRNPLHAVLGVVHVLGSEGSVSTFQRENIDAINSCCRLMCTVLDDVLDMSKIESGFMKLESIEFSLQKFLKEISQFGKMTTASKGLKWLCEFANHFTADESQDVLVLGDPTRLKQCLFNLITNGVKFTAKGCVSLNAFISAKSLENGTAILKFVVSDQGTGIPPESLKSIFKSYTQANLSISRTYGGSGLGLSIVKQLLNQMHGEVSVHSEVGIGSVFSIELPVPARCVDLRSVTAWEQEAEKKRDPSPLDLLPGSAQRHALQSMSEITIPSKRSLGSTSDSIASISESKAELVESNKKSQVHCLLVEDNELNRVVATMVLEQAGIRVTTANDGVDAVELWNRTPNPNDEFEVILMDLTMPRQNGVETAKILRDLGCKSVIIALTAHATEEERQKCIAAGMESFLAKPLRPEEFLRVFKKS
jgi:signal transduction histidine kinase/CheY-like chemotaxis protein